MSKTVLPDHMTDLLSPAAVKDPYAYFGKYREISPVVWNPQWKGWIFTSNVVVREGLAGDTMTNDRITRFEDQLTSRAGGDQNADIIYSAGPGQGRIDKYPGRAGTALRSRGCAGMGAEPVRIWQR